MREIVELNLLQTKRSKNAADTNSIVMEIDRRKPTIGAIGTNPTGNDTRVGVLYCAMGPGTKTHVSSKIDTHEVEYQES